MSTTTPTMRHVRGFDVARPLSIGMLVFMMMPLVFLPLLSIFIFGTNKGLASFWSALMAPEAIFALKLLGYRLQCSFRSLRVLRAFALQLLGSQRSHCYYLAAYCDSNGCCRRRFA